MLKPAQKLSRELVSYLIFGVLTTAVNYAFYFLLRALVPDTAYTTVIANVGAWFLSVLFAYITNRRFVFQSRAAGAGSIARECALFFASRAFTGVVDTLIVWVAVDRMGVDDRIVKLASNVVVILLNYALSKLWVFRRKSSSTE